MRSLLFVLLSALLPGLALAQTYPAKPIRIVVPWAPGGSTDVLARLIGIKMSENWGQPAVVENKPGASGNIGSDFVAKSPPDGYTLLVGSVSTHAMNPFLIAGMPFKGVDDFSTIALAAYVTNVLVTHPTVPAKSVRELIELLKTQPGKIAYASAGNGSPNHVAAELSAVSRRSTCCMFPTRAAARRRPRSPVARSACSSPALATCGTT